MRKSFEEYISDIVREIIKYNPKKIILFGSRARQDAKISSDIDIAVDADIDFRSQRKLKEDIEKVSGLYSVDVVFLNQINPEFRQKILSEGKVLYEKG